MKWIVLIVGILVAIGIFNPYNRLIWKAVNSSKRKEPVKPQLKHASFRITRGD